MSHEAVKAQVLEAVHGLAAYGLGVGATAALIWHSLAAMRRAETRRERSRGK